MALEGPIPDGATLFFRAYIIYLVLYCLAKNDDWLHVLHAILTVLYKHAQVEIIGPVENYADLHCGIGLQNRDERHICPSLPTLFPYLLHLALNKLPQTME